MAFESLTAFKLVIKVA